MHLLCKSLLAVCAIACLASPVRADFVAISLFNTGVDAAGNPLPNTAGSTDSHYAITVNPDFPAADGSTHVQNQSAFPIVGGPWVPNTPTAQWIGPRFDTGASAGGTYDYTLTFALPDGAELNTASFSGAWAFDDGGGVGGIYLNGNLIATANPGFSSTTPFSVGTGSLFFVDGVNTLTFQGTNGSNGFTGLFVDGLNGTVNVPEPSSWALLGLGLASFVGYRWKRRRAPRT